MRYVYFWTANAIFVIHFLLGIFFILGWQLTQYHLLYWLLMSAWIGSWIFLGYCPLSKWEFTLRSKYDKTIDPNREIIQHYLEKVTGIKVPSKKIIFWGVVVYFILLSLSIWKTST